MYFYPPPYWYQSAWYYATPWLWLDGNNDPAYQYSSWESYIINRIPVPSPLEIDVYAEYSTLTNVGFVDITIQNPGPDTFFDSKVICDLTESGIYYSAPNGLRWHDHVCRDMIPDESGNQFTVYPGTHNLHLNFTFDPAWVAANCEIVCFVQHDSLTADSVKEVLQGGKTSLVANAVEEQAIYFSVWLQTHGTPKYIHQSNQIGIGVLNAVEEIPSSPVFSNTFRLGNFYPNPFSAAANIPVETDRETPITLKIYDISGRTVRTLADGRTLFENTSFLWDGTDDEGLEVSRGVYRVELNSPLMTDSKLLIKIQ